MAIVCILCGLWHGANWTFLFWGIYHGAFLILERITGMREVSQNRNDEAAREWTLKKGSWCKMHRYPGIMQ